MTAQGLTLDIARDVVREYAQEHNIQIVPANDLRRQLVASAVAMVSPWTREKVLRDVSVTLPGVGPLASLLGSVPTINGYPVGQILAFLVEQWGDARNQVYFAPSVWNSAETLPAVAAHEFAHDGQLERAKKAKWELGTLLWVIGYSGAPEVRAVAEGQGYTQDMAVNVALNGWDVRDAAMGARRSLEGYILSEQDRVLVETAVGVAQRSLQSGARIGGPCCDILRKLHNRGVAVPEVWW